MAEGEGDTVSVVFVAYGGKGQPICICFGPGDHTVQRKEISPQRALKMASELIDAARRELSE